jgi:ribonuclease HII
MNRYLAPNKIIVGVDEAGVGPLVGYMYIGAVILPDKCPYDEHSDIWEKIRDSKTLTHKKRKYLANYIKHIAIDYSVVSIDNNTIDKINPRNSRIQGFHKAIDQLTIRPDKIIIDGDVFKPYYENDDVIPHECIIKGDYKYKCIAAASILAKVAHDEHIMEINKEYNGIYHWDKSMGYGTQLHSDMIKLYGITPYHRKTFGICKEWKYLPNIFI